MWRLASPGLAPLSAVFNVVQTAVLATNKLTLLAPGLTSALLPLILLPASAGGLPPALWLTFKGVDAGSFQRTVDTALSR
jgi:hypothetical protein